MGSGGDAGTGDPFQIRGVIFILQRCKKSAMMYAESCRTKCKIGIYRTVELAYERPRLLLEEKLSAKLTDVVLPRSGQKRKFCFADHHIRPR